MLVGTEAAVEISVSGVINCFDSLHSRMTTGNNIMTGLVISRPPVHFIMFYKDFRGGPNNDPSFKTLTGDRNIYDRGSFYCGGQFFYYTGYQEGSTDVA